MEVYISGFWIGLAFSHMQSEFLNRYAFSDIYNPAYSLLCKGPKKLKISFGPYMVFKQGSQKGPM